MLIVLEVLFGLILLVIIGYLCRKFRDLRVAGGRRDL